MKLDYSRGSMPLYLQIKKYIKSKIEKEEYIYGELIPTEPIYEEYFGVSRITVRQAINELQKEGYVRRIRGRGTEVIYTKEIKEELNHIQSFTEEISAKGFKPGTLYVKVTAVTLPKEIASLAKLPPDFKSIRVERVRTADDKPIVLFISHLVSSPNLPMASEAYEESMYSLIESRTGKRPTRVEETFAAIAADDRVAEALLVKRGSPILQRVRIAFDQDGDFLEHTNCFYRGDVYKYSITLFDNPLK